jgi:hypothetical protein
MREQLRLAIRQVDPEFGHHFENLGMHSITGRRASRSSLVCTVRSALEQRLAHL